MDVYQSFEGAQLNDRDGTPIPLLKAAVESANDAIIITEAELDLPGPRIEYVNPAFTRMTGYSFDEALGKTPRILQGERTDRALLSRLRVDLRNSLNFHGETINYRKDGTEYFVEWRITPLFDQAGKVSKWVAIQRDVTQRVLAEQERERLLESERQARAEAERQSRMKDEFLATLSHELRTPLNAIIGWSQLLQKPNRNDQDVEEGISVIGRNARSQAHLIEDLLDMSRIITGKIRMDVQRVDLPTVIEAAVDSVRHAAESKSVRIQLVLDPLAGIVSGDPSRLQQVVWNLLSNAVKFTPGGGRVQVVLERVNSHVEISVSDTGAGISPDFLPHVFDRFRQADATTTRRFAGLGIGLAIAKHIVELHGGNIRAKSPGEGKGATFIVALPVSILHRDTTTKPSSKPATSSFDGDNSLDCPPPLKGLTLLVVDDDPDARLLMHRTLTDCDAKVVLAASVQEAMERLTESVPSVLVSDIGMPGEDGYDLIRRVRSLPPEKGGSVPAVAVTAFARGNDRRRALIAGFDMHVSKPIEPVELLAVIARLATRRGEPISGLKTTPGSTTS